MIRKFDIHGNYEIPDLVLCQPTGKEIQTMSHALHIKITPRFNCFSELEFQVPKKMIINGEDYTVPYYDLIRKHRQVKVEGWGMFTIDTEPSVSDDGIAEIKTVTCKSIDYLLSNQDLVDFKGTYQLFDIAGSSDTIMSIFLKQFNNEWKISEVDAGLYGVYRTYDISEMNWYEFLVQKVEDDFQCIFIFDTLKKEIKIKTVKNAIRKTDIFISKENLLKKVDIKESEDGIKTCLSIHGADGVDVRRVNPLGTTYRYNLDYYCDESLKFLSSDTIQAYKAWKAKYKTQEVAYNNLTISYNAKLKELVVLEGELVELNHQLDNLKNLLSVRIQQGLNTSDIRSQMTTKENQIKTKETQITNKKNEISNIDTQKTAINKSIDFKAAFTKDQWGEVWAILRSTTGTYTNESFSKTDLMSDAEIQEKARDLFSLGGEILDRMAVPRFSFTSEVINFLMLEEFDTFANQLELGCEVTLQVGDNLYYPILLEYPIDFDDYTNSSMVFCNDLRLNDDSFALADIMNGVNNTVTSNNKMQGTWGDYVNSGDKDKVSQLMGNTLDLANKKVLSSTGQAPLIDHTGIWGRKMLDNGTLSPYQVAMTSNGIYMTDSNWTKPARLALGEITFNGVTTYGIATDLLVGNFICGRSLMINNESNTFKIDARGFSATNGSITLKRSDGSSELYINPTDGIKIKTKVNNILQDVFFVDGAGNLNFKGNLTGAKGTFSGEIKGSSFMGGSIDIGNGEFTVDNIGNCVANSLTANNATFRSCNLSGSVFRAGTIEAGTIEGSNIYGSSFVGGTIDIETNARVGSILYLGGNSTGCGIQFGNGVKMEGNFDGVHVYGAISCDSDLMGRAVYDNFRRVATEDWCENNFASKSKIPTRSSWETVARHNHGLRDGDQIMLVGGGSVTWRAYDGDDHRHDIY